MQFFFLHARPVQVLSTFMEAKLPAAASAIAAQGRNSQKFARTSIYHIKNLQSWISKNLAQAITAYGTNSQKSPRDSIYHV